MQGGVIRTSDLEAFSREIMILEKVTEIEADPGVLDRLRIFNYHILYYLEVNISIKKSKQDGLYMAT